jgi:Ni/Co efflux regulator RcnB
LLKKTIASAILFGVCCTPLASLAQQYDHRDAQQQNDHHDDHRQQYVRHQEWRKGYHMNHDDWNRGQRVDYRTYHLRQPPRGYEWREVDGNYVMAAVTTGIIASVIAASAGH